MRVGAIRRVFNSRLFTLDSLAVSAQEYTSVPLFKRTAPFPVRRMRMTNKDVTKRCKLIVKATILIEDLAIAACILRAKRSPS
jgi:hypothetical protein